MIETPGGAKCAQTAAISIVLGKELGFSPEDPAAFAKACQIIEDANDLFTEISGGKDDERIKKWFQHFENNFTGASQMKKPLIEGFSKLNAWIEMMTNLESSKKLKATGVPFLPEQYGGFQLLPA